ncbi:MAG: hypothetical protein GYB66_08575 [Chloroflexi bacterium]|jgi:hypothetical protein|nr:hypothetical protein [Chloroflexota bacterium]
MDMLNQLQKLVSGENGEQIDAELKQDVRAAYMVEEPRTSSDLLLRRLMAHAEATPQLSAENAGFTSEGASEYPLEEPQPVVAPRGGWLARLFGSGRLRYTPEEALAYARQRARELDWELLYHEYVEYYLRHMNAGSGLKPL